MLKLGSIAVIALVTVWWTSVSTINGRMTGGLTSVSVDSDAVKNVTNFAVEMYNKGSNAINYKQLIAIKDARQQVVAGRRYVITFTIGETQCTKNGPQVHDVKTCPLTTATSLEVCTATIWQRVWLNSTQLTSLECH